jgi:glycosyltransferase involved in cell wall biosynthesis
VHNNPFLDYSFTYGRLLGGLAALFHVHALAPIDAVVGCSFSVSDVISRSLKRPVSTIQVGVSNIEGACKNKKDNLTYARSIINVPLSTTVFLSVCNLISRKDVETIIKGFKLANLPRDCLLLIVGAGPDEGRLRSLISQDNIRLIGWVESVSDFFSAADFFVSASLSEGLPAAPVEAMCRGVIPILSDIPPHRELLSGVDKPLIFTPGDYRGLSVILKTALSIERGKLSSDVSTYARQKFSAETMSKNYDLIYKGLKSQRLMDKDSTYKS